MFTRTAALAALALAGGLSQGVARAQPSAVLDARESTLYVAWGGGFGPRGKNGSAGSEVPVGLEAPASLHEQGSDHYFGIYLDWTVAWDTSWNVQQHWSLADHTLSGWGSTSLYQVSSVTGPGCPDCAASVINGAQNWQALEFTLDADSSFLFHSEVSLEQGAQVLRWNDARQRWDVVLSSVAGGTVDHTGVLAAGRWRVVNSRSYDRITGPTSRFDSAWSWSLTLPEAQFTTAVPEAPAPWLWAAGIAWLAWRRRGG